MKNTKRKFAFVSKFTIEEHIYFAQRLAFLLNAGIPIVDSLTIIKNNISRSKVPVINHIIEEVNSGQLMAASLERSKAFQQFFCQMVFIGETSGNLGKNLVYAATELKKKHTLRKKVLSALFYPVFISMATFAITSVLIFYIFPKIMPVFKSMNIDLPATTKLVIFTSDLFLNYWWLALTMIVILFTVLPLVFKKLPIVPKIFTVVCIHLPIAKKIVVSYNLANFCRTLGLLLQSGLPIEKALEMTQGSLHNVEYKHITARLRVEVGRGGSIAQVLKMSPRLFPSLAVSLLGVGEMTGKLGDICVFLSEMYEEEVEGVTKTLSTSIEPFLMLFMGGVVGFVALSIITPIYEVTQHLQ